MPAVAMTDHGNLFGAVEFYNKAKEQGRPSGHRLRSLRRPAGSCTVKNDTNRYNHLVLLCENQEGYRNLINLVSTGYLDGFYYKPRIDKDLLARHSKGLIALSACLRGDINETLHGRPLRRSPPPRLRVHRPVRQEQFLPRNSGPRPRSGQASSCRLVNRLSQETGIPLVATNDSHYLRKDDARVHEILLCIQTGKTMSDPNRMRFTTPEFYLKTRDEMLELFGEVEDALDRTWDIAQRCHVKLEKVKDPFPKFDVPDRTLHRHLLRIRRAAGIREAPSAPRSPARRRAL